MPCTINRAKPSDYRDIVSIYSLANETLTLDARLSDTAQEALLASLEEEIESEHVFIVREDYKAVAFAIVERNLEDAFFPSTRSFSKANELLDAIDHTGENVMAIRAIYVAANHQRKKIGTDLLRSLFGRYKDSSWLLWNIEKNVGTTRFFLENGFVILEQDFHVELEEKPLLVLCRKYRPTGLCREAFW